MKIYDTFMLHDEVDLLQVRMQEHDPFVDYFVIVQGDLTHTGKPKRILSIKADPKFKNYRNKIIEVTALLDENPKSAWVNEQKQRDVGLSSIMLQNDDLVYVSDADEIISRDHWPHLIQRLKTENIIGVWQDLFYYSLNLQAKDVVWTLPKICRGSVIKNSKITASQLRVLPSYLIPSQPCGWHFSYLMPPEEVSKKISAFAHQEYNTSEINHPEALSKAIRSRQDLFGRNINYHVVPFNDKWPIGVLRDPKWQDYILSTSAKERLIHNFARIKKSLVLDSIRSGLVTKLNQIRFCAIEPTDYNVFDKRTFNELILCKPEHMQSGEWRKLIEFLSGVLPQLEGWFSAKQCAELFIQIVKSVPKNGKIVEVGSWKGRSSVFASRAAAVSSSTLFCVDTWKGNVSEGDNHPTVLTAKTQDVFQEFQKNILLYGCNNVSVCKGESHQVAANWNQGPIDLLFVDAGHDYDSVLCDLKSWTPHLKPGAIVCGDDWNRDERDDLKGSVRKAFNDFFKTQIPNLGITERFWVHQVV